MSDLNPAPNDLHSGQERAKDLTGGDDPRVPPEQVAPAAPRGESSVKSASHSDHSEERARAEGERDGAVKASATGGVLLAEARSERDAALEDLIATAAERDRAQDRVEALERAIGEHRNGPPYFGDSSPRDRILYAALDTGQRVGRSK